MLMQYIPVPQIDYATLTVSRGVNNHDRGRKVHAEDNFVKFNFNPLNNKAK